MKLKLLNELLEQEKEEGYSRNEIEDAEKRIGIKFPEIVYELYVKFGKNNILNGHHYLVPPKYIGGEAKRKTFGFYSENQSVCTWLIKMENEVPVVYRLDDDLNETFEESNLEFFLIRNCLLYFSNALYKCRFDSNKLNENDRKIIKQIYGEPKWEYRKDFEFVEYYWNTMNCVVLISRNKSKERLYICSKSENFVEELIDKLNKTRFKKLYDETEMKKHHQRMLVFENDFIDINLENLKTKEGIQSKRNSNDLPS